MQIIQGIRDKGAVIFSIVIAIALVSFILMSAEKGNGTKLFSGNNSTIGTINGTTIEKTDFDKRVIQEENKQAAQNGQQPSGAEVLRIHDQVWNQIVAENVFYKEADKLGITLTSKELSAILLSNDRQNPLMQEKELLDANGNLDQDKARDAVNNIKKLKDDKRDMVDAQIVEPLKLSTAAAKYGGLISASAYYPSWMKERDMADAKTFANISYTGVAYAEIPDSSVTVTDEDINNYVAKKKDMFKQEAGRVISYLSFSQLASAKDSGILRDQIASLKDQFAADTSAKSFTEKNASTIDFNDEYLPLSKITSTVKDTIVKQPIGTVYGPYVDGTNFVLAKVIGTKPLPDSVKARHILIAANDLQTHQPIMPDSVAKKLADSILTAVKGGADFAALAIKYSADKGSGAKGGDLGTFGYGTMVPEFNEFTFTKPVGSKDVVQTQFGYHVIEILSQTNFKPAYKIAYLGKQIVPSEETIDAASRAATQASASKNSKELADYAAKHGLKIIDLPGVTIKENDYAVGNMQDARNLVRWIFNAKKGEVSDALGVGDQFIVATVNKIYDEGVQDAATARPNAEVAVRNRKKADLVIAKLGANPTLESAAAAYNKQVLTAGADSSITMNSRIINGLGAEPKVIGAAFNKDYQSKVSPAIPAATGVYLIKVNSLGQKAEPTDAQKATQTATQLGAIRQATGNWFEALRKQADIKDKRSKFF
jgi:peptidyl-prolyl cis-trans isomerase D